MLVVSHAVGFNKGIMHLLIGGYRREGVCKTSKQEAAEYDVDFVWKVLLENLRRADEEACEALGNLGEGYQKRIVHHVHDFVAEGGDTKEANKLNGVCKSAHL